MVDRISGQNGLISVVKQKPLRKLSDVAKTVAATDEANISPFAKELNRIMGELERIPEVRQEKVNEFRKQITEGTYKPDPAKVAQSLLVAGFLNGEE